MTPEERRRVDELFDRLASLETAPRDRDAEQTIAEGLRRAPNATYALVQTVLVQDEALRAAEARIAELEEAGGGAAREAPRGFLDSMREQIFGREERRGSVPSVGAGSRMGGYMNRPDDAPRAGAGGGSFLGTAAAAAAGVIGGSLLVNSLGGMFGQSKQGQSMFDTANANASEKSSGPWSDNSNNAGGDLARDAGLSDVGNRNESRQGLFDSSGDNRHQNGQAAADSSHGDEFDAAGFDGFDFDSDFG